MTRHVRGREPRRLSEAREIVVVCAPLRSNVNLSTIIRTAGCCAVPRVIATGNPKVHSHIARDGMSSVDVEVRSSLLPVLERLRIAGFNLVGLEQATNSANIHSFIFPHRTALVIGNERTGIPDQALRMLDACVEIPVWGLPHSYNVATATSIALYEYCRQFPD